jgi:hypothetical protein
VEEKLDKLIRQVEAELEDIVKTNEEFRAQLREIQVTVDMLLEKLVYEN